MTREERIQLNNLSKLVYGKSNKWAKMVTNGEIADQQETLKDGTIRKYKGYSYYTVAEVKKIMEDIWAEEQENIKKREEGKNTVVGTIENV